MALAWLAIAEHILVGFAPRVGRWLPAAAGQAIVRTPLDDLVSPVTGTVVLAAYAVVIAAAGIRFAVARDARTEGTTTWTCPRIPTRTTAPAAPGRSEMSMTARVVIGVVVAIVVVVIVLHLTGVVGPLAD